MGPILELKGSADVLEVAFANRISRFNRLPVLISPAAAQTKRALLIGIDTYEAEGKTDQQTGGSDSTKGDAADAGRWDLREWGNLDGSLNDVESVHELLASPKYGFAENNIHIVEEEKATREGILQAMKKYLLDEPSRGDTVVFYYAGHGSQRYNSLTDKPFHLDETIVPADAEQRGIRHSRQGNRAPLQPDCR